MYSIVLLYMLLASTFTIGKAVLAYTQPIFFIGIRMIIGGGLLLAYIRFFHKSLWKLERKHARLCAQIMFVHIYCAFVLEFIALEHMTSAKACLLYSFSPFITALFAYCLWNERLNTKKCIGLSVGLLGFVPILMATSADEGTTFLRISVPEITLLLAVTAGAYGWLLVQDMMRKGYSPLMINGIGMLGGGCMALITAFIFESTNQQPIMTDWPLFLVYTAALILITNVIFYNLYGMLLHVYSATFISFAGFMCPLFAAFYGWLFLGEHISAAFFISVAIITLGLYLFYQQELEDRKSIYNK